MMRVWRIAAVATPAALLALHRLDAADVWIHLATGRFVATNGLPSRDPFGAPPAAAWLVQDWLASLILAGTHAVGGVPALVLLAAALCAAAVVVPLALAMRDRLPPLAFEIAAFVATLIAYERFFVRPEAFTFLLAVVWVQALARGAPRNRRQWWALIGLQILWANLHAAFALGPLLAVLRVAGESFDRWRRDKRWRRPSLQQAALPLVLLLACCINPYGPRLLVHVFAAGRDVATTELRRGIVEWQPTFAAPVAEDITLIAFVTSLACVAIVALRGWRHMRGFEVLAVAMFAILACTSRRHLALWALAALPLAAAWWARESASGLARRTARATPSRARPQPPSASRRALAGAMPAAICVVALLFAFDVARGQFYRRFGPPRTLGWGLSPADHPLDAAEFVSRHGLNGPVFNNVAAGSVLMWSVGPRLPVWVDGRLLDAARFNSYRRCLSSPAAFDALAASRDLRLVVLALQPHAPVRLIQHLYRAPQWRLVFLDGEGAVFVRDDAPISLPRLALESALPAAAAPIGSSGGFWRACDPDEAARRGLVLAELGFTAAARADLGRALVHCPDRRDLAAAMRELDR